MLYFILIVVALVIIGFVANVINIRTCSNNYNFLVEYRDKFSKFISDLLNKNKYSNKDYEWLMSNSDKVQIVLGDAGIISYKDISGYYPNYQIVINFMNEVMPLFSKGLIETESEKITWCHNAFLRKIGIYDEYIKKEIKKTFNPLYDLTNGIKVILGIPLDILYSIGLISSKSMAKIKDNILFKLLGGIISLLTFLSTIMSIVLGWNDFIDLIKEILNIT